MPSAAAAPRNPVLVHLHNARAAGERYGVDPAIILAILEVEGGTDTRGRPVAPRDGLGPPSFGQFTTSTGRALGVVYGDSRSETDAIARYLLQLGYSTDATHATRAIAAYNGGPGNPQYGYARRVLDAARRYSALTPGLLIPGTRGSASASVPLDVARDASATSSRLIDDDKRSGALKALVWVMLVSAGMVLFGLGTTRAFGLRGAHP